MRNARRIHENVTLGVVPDADDLVQLKELGYRTVVDVRDEEEKFGGWVERKAEALGVRYVGIPISREDIRLDDVIRFFRIVHAAENAPVYVFSRYGKKPLAFLLLFEAVARGESLARIYQRAARIGIQLYGDLCLQAFLVDFFNRGHIAAVLQVIRECRPDLLKAGAGHREMIGARPTAHLASCIQRHDREALLGQRGCTIWLTGLPGAGKTTTAFTLETRLVKLGCLTYVLDSDNIRHGLSSDLGFTAIDRAENSRRIGHVARLFADAGCVAIASSISPYAKDRDEVRRIHDEAGIGFVEVFVDTPLGVCTKRDSRDLYRRAREGEIVAFTGVDDPYEPPRRPEVAVHPETMTPDEIVDRIVAHLEGQRYLPGKGQASTDRMGSPPVSVSP